MMCEVILKTTLFLWEFIHTLSKWLFFVTFQWTSFHSSASVFYIQSIFKNMQKIKSQTKDFCAMDRCWRQVDAGMGLLGEQWRCLQSSIYSQRTHRFLHHWFPGRRLLDPRFFDGLFSRCLQQECAHFNLGVSTGRLKLLSKMSHPSSRTYSAM